MQNFSSSPPSITPRPKIKPERLLNGAVLLGVVLVALAMIWVGLMRGKNLQQEWFTLHGVTFLVDFLIGIGIGASFSMGLWFVGMRLTSFVHIRQRFYQIFDLPSMRLWHIIVLSWWAAVPEEIFFRGAMQPVFGLVLTALIFGALHAMTPTYFVYATCAGLGLGLMIEWQGSLWMPIGAHFGTDATSLLLMVMWARRQIESLPSALSPILESDRTEGLSA
jgi:membrane protease YdiL (CAAX protease family)